MADPQSFLWAYSFPAYPHRYPFQDPRNDPLPRSNGAGSPSQHDSRLQLRGTRGQAHLPGWRAGPPKLLCHAQDASPQADAVGTGPRVSL